MAARTDTTTLPEARICEICGVTQQYRRSLVKRGLVRAAPRRGCTLRDALELVAIKEMSDSLGALDTTTAASQLSSVLADSIPMGRFDLIYDMQYKLLSVARSDSELRDLVIHRRPIKVFALGEQFAQTGDAFRRLVEATRLSRRRSSSPARKTATGPRATTSPQRPSDDGGA